MGFKTDHSMIIISAALHSNQRGPGCWKLNTSFLSGANYVNQIRATIKKVTDEYVNDYSVNPTLMWEMIKLKIREQSIKYAKDRRTKTSRREEEIEKAINDLQELIESSNKGDREKKRSLQGPGGKKKLNWKKLLNIGLKVQYSVPNADGITRAKETQSIF